MANLWSLNTPAQFWRCRAEVEKHLWQAAFERALPTLGLAGPPSDPETTLALVLGEGQFGDKHWTLSLPAHLYYQVKAALPKSLILAARRLSAATLLARSRLRWPIEPRYAIFQWEVMQHLLIATGRSSLPIVSFWPFGRQYALVLTHDIETARGQAYCRAVADVEQQLGFRSSFNFVAEDYPIDYGLVRELRARDFEIGLHGLKHDNRLFASYAEFVRQAGRINRWQKELGVTGFRSPSTLRNPEWMQALEIEYDLSFFDTDPYEPMAGGTMCIWPFFIGRFVELPYTLAQDHTLVAMLCQKTPRLWLEKVEFIRQYNGMVLVNTHPDDLWDSTTLRMYVEFLEAMKSLQGYWHALPCEVARWWRARHSSADGDLPPGAVVGEVRLSEGNLVVETVHRDTPSAR